MRARSDGDPSDARANTVFNVSTGGSTLLERAGVIGAEVLDPLDTGTPFIPVPAAPDTTRDQTRAAKGPATSIISDTDFASWQPLGVSRATAATLHHLGAAPDAVEQAPVSADELVGWLWHGFTIDEVDKWRPHGSVRFAARQRNAGLGPKDR